MSRNTFEIPRRLLIGLKRVLYMPYLPAELAEELGVEEPLINRYINAGAPTVDYEGELMIVGTEFVKWIEAVKKKRRNPMEPGQAFCLRCNKPVEMLGPLTVKAETPYATIMAGTCAECRGVVCRARAKEAEAA